MSDEDEVLSAAVRLKRVHDGENPVIVYNTAIKPHWHNGPWGGWDKIALAQQRIQEDKEELADDYLRRVFSDDQCFQLNAAQHDHRRHPYTCGNDSKHRPLIATAHGWRCADCDYQQGWAHEADKKGPPE